MVDVRTWVFGIALVLVSGCLSGPASPAASVSTSATDASLAADVGRIVGAVTDDEAVPVGGATVSVDDREGATTTTDDAGRFEIGALAPGTVSLIAQKIGYEPYTARVDVKAGETTDVKVLLQPIVVDIPYNATFIDDGYMPLGVYGPGVGTSAGGTLGTDVRQFKHDSGPGLQDVITSMQWTSTTAVTARYLYVSTLVDGSTKNTSAGRTPLRSAAESLNTTKPGTFGSLWGVHFPCPTTSPQCFVNNPDALLPQIAYEQRVKIYQTAFYNGRAPAGFTGLPTR